MTRSDEGRKRRSKEMNDKELIFEVSNIRWVREKGNVRNMFSVRGMIGRKAGN